MTYAVYKAIVQLSNSVVEALEYIKEHSEMVSILLDANNAILTIKNKLESNNEIVISEFEEFFYKVAEIANNIENNQKYIYKLNELYELSIRIATHCKKNLKYKFKIVFFAELGSKWDSMDSVYKAFKNRTDCEVTVVLAPIYRAIKLPNGEVKSDIIYEDYLTPMGIPHIPFQKYDIKKELPDMAFTSQPYESVTPEQFWAENIVPYTRLVYLPYFTAGIFFGDEEKFCQCQMPMHKLAWKVICQTEKVKEIYSKYFPTKGENIIATGLPKWDWVVNMKEREVVFPKEWEKLKGKKVILKNQHYVFKPENLLKVLRDSIEYFKDSDVGLLYRFHPMTETMFKVYYPSYKEEWEKVKREIELSSNVAIDYNTTYDVAFYYSDILLTGYSSIISQYLLTKKPVVLIGRLEKYKECEENENTFLKLTELYLAENSEIGYEVCEKILKTGDYEYKKRMNLIKEWFPNAGNIGLKIADDLIEELKKEEI